jgi:tetratricopeptide (TPR) repeat protein
VALDPELRQRVLAVHAGLDQLDHYTLLGVNPSADRRAIKRAYFELAAVFHPDKYFRKRLGSFKPRMEAIFARVTLAHDVLANREARAEYDAYLDARRRARGIEETLSAAEGEAQRAADSVDREVEAAEANSQATPPAPSPAPPVPKGPSVDVAARRETLARRLLGGRAAKSPVTPQAPSPALAPTLTAQSPSDAVEALRRRYLDRVAQARLAQARKYASRADEAASSGNIVAAANALRVASTLAPRDETLQARAAEAQRKADALLGDTYMNQASYEEKNGQWSEAARSWAKAARGRPADASAHERAANAIVKAGGDLHEARRLATRACEINPTSSLNRTTLAAVYLAAGLELNARRELEAAAQLGPVDDTIRAMLEKLSDSK